MSKISDYHITRQIGNLQLNFTPNPYFFRQGHLLLSESGHPQGRWKEICLKSRQIQWLVIRQRKGKRLGRGSLLSVGVASQCHLFQSCLHWRAIPESVLGDGVCEQRWFKSKNQEHAGERPNVLGGGHPEDSDPDMLGNTGAAFTSDHASRLKGK